MSCLTSASWSCLGPHFEMAQVPPRSFEEFASIAERSSARKAERNVMFPNHHVAERPVKIKSWDAPWIEGFARRGHCLLYQTA